MRVSYMYPEGRARALTFSFDDGVFQDEKLVQLFDRFGFKGTFNINSGLGGLYRHLDIDKEIYDRVYGEHEIACHGEGHATFDQIPRGEVMREIWHDREVLEAVTGRVITGLAYPNGSCSPAVADILRAGGIEYGRTVKSTGIFRYMPEDFLFWHPTCHYRDSLELVSVFLGEKRPLPQLFYIWGHAYELDDNNGWQLMEKLGSLLGGRGDIWYATNIEVCRYIKAIRSLIFSADGKRVYNPTAQTVWFLPDWEATPDECCCVSPGETLKF